MIPSFQVYRQMQAVRSKPHLDYPYLSIPDEDEEDFDPKYPESYLI